MKVKSLVKDSEEFAFGKIYDVIAIEYGMYRIIPDNDDEDYLYLPSLFEVVESGGVPVIEDLGEDEEELERIRRKCKKVTRREDDGICTEYWLDDKLFDVVFEPFDDEGDENDGGKEKA